MKKTKFTIIDAGIILLVAVLVLVGMKVVGIGFGGEETKEVYFTVLGTKAEEGVSEAIKEGDKVSISFSEEAYATVVSATEEPHKEYQLIEGKGIYSEHELEGKSDVKVLLKCDAKVSDTDISNGNVPIRVGEETPVCGKGYTVKGYVIDVEER